jgi:hypothetical protein
MPPSKEASAKRQKISLYRGYQLIGEFVFNWNLLEEGLNDAIGKGLQLHGTKRFVATANISFRDKLSMVKTLVELKRGDYGNEWADAASSVLNKIGKLAGHRNLIVHTPFNVAEDGTVQFLKVEAKGRFGLPDIRWTEAMFRQRYREIQKLDMAVEEITQEIGPYSGTALGRLIAGEDSWTTLGKLGLTNPRASKRPAQALRHSGLDTASPETTDETLPSPPPREE